MKKIAIIIPHFNGEEILKDCLSSLQNQTSTDFTINIIDNGSSDSSVLMVKREFPSVRIFELSDNLGYSGGCNYGINKTQEPFVLLLNNDTVQSENFIETMLKKIESNSVIAAIQPKLISYQDKEKFDYSGACGGEIDYLGYPFARGRIFETIENDINQYDLESSQIFWASGTAVLLRREALNKSGLLDDHFFAHMEEIDLCWRLQSLGYEIHIEPKATVYHYSGYTLGAMNPKKMYLNHRNNLIMLYKNLESSEFNKLFNRILLEFMTIFISFLKFDINRIKAVSKALSFFLFKRKLFKEARDHIQKKRVVSNSSLRIYNKSIVLKSYIFGIKKYSELLFK